MNHAELIDYAIDGMTQVLDATKRMNDVDAVYIMQEQKGIPVEDMAFLLEYGRRKDPKELAEHLRLLSRTLIVMRLTMLAWKHNPGGMEIVTKWAPELLEPAMILLSNPKWKVVPMETPGEWGFTTGAEGGTPLSMGVLGQADQLRREKKL